MRIEGVARYSNEHMFASPLLGGCLLLLLHLHPRAAGPRERGSVHWRPVIQLQHTECVGSLERTGRRLIDPRLLARSANAKLGFVEGRNSRPQCGQTSHTQRLPEIEDDS